MGLVCVHCFTGSRETLDAYVKRGYYVGLTGFAGMAARGAHLRAMIADGALPVNRLLLETDSPYMMPDAAYRAPIALTKGKGKGRKMEPCGMPGVCRAVAECMSISAQELANITTQNARAFFHA